MIHEKYFELADKQEQLLSRKNEKKDFYNGVIVNENNEVFIYYASSDTRIHVATTTIEKLIDYTFNTPVDPLHSLECAEQRIKLIEKNLRLLGNN
ncbi:hypothetical protein [Halalkalibacter urbisdiaboli]|uniref:hypothetical protein n=1 Tax=Halalkalibacter urbisdiaboli TaxID=1960589 RepID=UPI003CC9A3E6